MKPVQPNSSKFADPMDVLETVCDGKIPPDFLRNDAALAEMQEIAEDLACAESVSAEFSAREKAVLSFSARDAIESNFSGRPHVLAFRSGKRIVHSDLVPLENDYLILELSADEAGMSLLIEKGTKNAKPVPISLYRGGTTVEFLLIKSRVQKDLSSLAPGKYSVACEGRSVLNFSLFDENENHNQGRSHHR